MTSTQMRSPTNAIFPLVRLLFSSKGFFSKRRLCVTLAGLKIVTPHPGFASLLAFMLLSLRARLRNDNLRP